MAVALAREKLSCLNWFSQINPIATFKFKGGLHYDWRHTKGVGYKTNFNAVPGGIHLKSERS